MLIFLLFLFLLILIVVCSFIIGYKTSDKKNKTWILHSFYANTTYSESSIFYWGYSLGYFKATGEDISITQPDLIVEEYFNWKEKMLKN